jgi:4-amino-4-deoxy-L-arabinose transferase-like glycosyltransferase
VTYAAHYPVGYPALLALPYAIAPSPTAAMLLHALIGAAGTLALMALTRRHGGERSARWAGWMAALHPGLVLYTPALMTEGVIAAWLACAAWAASKARDGATRKAHIAWAIGAALWFGIAVLIRPQCLLLAPGALAAPMAASNRRRLAYGIGALVVALAVCAPWTARNCQRMGRCALVSVNGGWNLLIGTQPSDGGWAELEVPAGCREVFDEAGKDACFEREARRRIAAAPGAWLARMPDKWAVTFDYCGAAGWYLHAANPAAFPAASKTALGVVETAYERALVLLALLGSWAGWGARGWGRRVRLLIFAVGVLSALWWHAAPAWIAVALLAGWRASLWRRPLFAWVAALVASLFLVHGAFFGAGRYQLSAWVLMCAPAALGVSRWRRTHVSLRAAASSIFTSSR